MKKQSLCLALVLLLTACGAPAASSGQSSRNQSAGSQSSGAASSGQSSAVQPVEPAPAGPALDLDAIAAALTDSGCFPDSLEAQDPGLVPGQLCLYEDRIEAGPEDVADARYSMALGVVADQFFLIEAADAEAADRLERALDTYAEDQRSAYEFYNPEQAARLDDPVRARRGNYLLFAIGSDRDELNGLCNRLMDGEAVDLPAAPEPAPLTAEELEAARQAALAYYAGTVFEVRELTPLEPGEAPSWEGEAIFRVACSKGGQEQVDRTIALSRQDGAWTVVGEGY